MDFNNEDERTAYNQGRTAASEDALLRPEVRDKMALHMMRNTTWTNEHHATAGHDPEVLTALVAQNNAWALGYVHRMGQALNEEMRRERTAWAIGALARHFRPARQTLNEHLASLAT